MKKIFLMVVALFACVLAGAQTITAPNANLKLAVKSIQKVDSGIELTLLLTNKSDTEINVNLVGGQYQTGMAGSVAYDNEGNVYELGDVLVAVGNKSYAEQYCGGNIPAGVSVKCRVCVKNLDPVATQLSYLKLCLLCPQLQINSTGIGFEVKGINL